MDDTTAHPGSADIAREAADRASGNGEVPAPSGRDTASSGAGIPAAAPTPASDLEDIRRRARIGAAVRAGIGLGPLLAPTITARLFGFPKDQITPGAKLIARFFGVRELALAAIVLTSLDEADDLGRASAISAAVDINDAVIAAVALRKGEGLRIAAALSLLAAAGGAAVWLDVLRRIDD